MVTENTQIPLPNVTNVLTLYKTRMEELLKKKIEEKGNIASGNLLASIHTRLEVEGDVYEVWLDTLKYLKFLDKGTKPHFVPEEPILKWVKEKRLPTRELMGDKKLPTEKQLAYLVRKSISEKGTKAYNTFTETLEDLNNEYIPLIENALRQDIYNYFMAMELHFDFVMKM